jgi:hypothetical protein
MASLLGAPLSVVTVGLASFDDAIAGAGARVTRVQWSPPGGEPATARALARLVGDPAVDAANRKAFDAYLAAEPRRRASACARRHPGLAAMLHPAADRVGAHGACAVRDAVPARGLKDHDAARTLVESARSVRSVPSCAAVGPMAGSSALNAVWMLRPVSNRPPATERGSASARRERRECQVLSGWRDARSVLARRSWRPVDELKP